MTRTICLNANDLRNVLRFASDEESRPILNAVCIEAGGVFVATNGHTLLAVAPDSADNECKYPANDILLRFPKAPPVWATHASLDIVDSAKYGDVVTVTYHKPNTSKQAHGVAYLVEGPYPKWRRALSGERRPDAPIPPITGELLAQFAFPTDSKQMGVKLTAGATEASAVTVRVGDVRYFGLIMPLRSIAACAQHSPEPPQWCRE